MRFQAFHGLASVSQIWWLGGIGRGGKTLVIHPSDISLKNTRPIRVAFGDIAGDVL